MGALIVGILSILFCMVPVVGVVLGIVALVLGVRGMGRAKEAGQSSTQALIGTVLGAVGIITGIFGTLISGGALMGALMWSEARTEPAMQTAPLSQPAHTP